MEKRVSLTVDAIQDQTGRVHITVMSTWGTVQLVIGIICSVLTCGLLAVLVGPLLYLKYNRMNQNVAIAVALLKADLGG